MHRDDLTVEKSTTGAREIDRRTIAKGVAWTVPVVIVATAAPAAAASGSVQITGLTGAFDPSTGGVTVTVVVSSTGAGNTITFLSVSRGSSSTPVNQTKTLSRGSSNTFSFIAPTSGGVANTYVLTYSINGGAAQPMSFTAVSPTSYSSGTATRTQNAVTFHLNFTGSTKSKITITAVKPDLGSLSGALPAPDEVLGADLAVSFGLTRNQTGAKPTTADVTFTVDGGTADTKTITVP
ncbi:hypothetical protein SAMN05216199_1013 [Pedococcus cremeus]|uniref:Uncharacterized protein n=1 Tax=Pedococcus cremeus TaxID=587636 RepID=A0A1H9RJU3_9MICO|nr:hypothetical protein [Pedococcus cremeus]SER72974.1 hypothetical protein SAMN05216199_1013 [Pedococcus cremeus]